MSQESVIDPIAIAQAQSAAAVKGQITPEHLSVSLFDLQPQHCRWPMWDDAHTHAEHLFCGQTKQVGSSYCARHSRRAFGRSG